MKTEIDESEIKIGSKETDKNVKKVGRKEEKKKKH